MYIFPEARSFVLHFKSYFILFCLDYLDISCNKELLQSEFSLEARYAYVTCVLNHKMKSKNKYYHILFQNFLTFAFQKPFTLSFVINRKSKLHETLVLNLESKYLLNVKIAF